MNVMVRGIRSDVREFCEVVWVGVPRSKPYDVRVHRIRVSWTPFQVDGVGGDLGNP